MRCFYCKQDSEWLETTTSQVVDFEGRIIIIKNVPCKVCPCCGEKMFSSEVCTKSDELFSKAKLTLYDYAEIDYEDPAKKVYRLVKELVKEQALSRVAENIIYGAN